MPAWLDPLLDAEEMRATDRWAVEERRIASLELMEAAGRALAEATAIEATAATGAGPIVVLCGAGNNGGDGLVAARLLHGWGRTVEVALLTPAERLSPDAASNLQRLPSSLLCVPAADLRRVAEMADDCIVLVDALLGTGFSGLPREPVAGAIRVINAAKAPVVAADIASGVDASTGEAHIDPEARLEPDARVALPQRLAVQATRTVSFHAAKPGHLIAPGKRYRGELTVAAIGIPQEGSPQVSPRVGRILPAVLDGLPRRGADSTKFSSGRVVVVGGSRGLTGAPCLAAEAAIRAGAGYATVAVPADLEPIFEQKLTEVMSIGCAGSPGRLNLDSLSGALAACKPAEAVLLGPGIGREPGTLDFVRSFAVDFEGPLVIDADGLAAFGGGELESLQPRGTTVLTPHEGELSHLLGRPSAAVAETRLAAAKEAARRSGSIVVLKGDDTVVTDGERVAINDLPAPALATAGTGDVLAGLLAALLARLGDPFHAASAAVLAHARAGLAASSEIGLAESVIAGDVIKALPRALRR